MQWTNEQGQVVKLTGLGDIEITALTVDETSSDDLFRVRCKSMSVSWLSDDNTLYVAPPRGTAVTLTVDGVTVFTGVVATVPTKQPYNYRYATPDEAVLRAESADDLRTAIDALPADMRTAPF